MFAQQAERIGLQTSATNGDVSHLWRKVLQPQLRKSTVPLVGLTLTPSLFCLSELAKNHWMKVQFFAEHKSLADGTIQHNLSGPENILRQANLLTDATCNWPESIMKLPPNTTEKNFLNAVAKFQGAVGKDWVFISQEDVDLYRDSYSPFKGEPDKELVASAAVAPNVAVPPTAAV